MGEITHVGRVPAFDSGGTSDVREPREVSLSGETASKAVRPVGAGYREHGAAAIIESLVITDYKSN